MTKMTYRDQLLHPNWQRLRLRMLESSGWQCSNCGESEDTLHVHHRQYFKGRMVWEYGPEELVVLCSQCHANEHLDLDSLKRILSMFPAGDVAAFVGGMHNFDDWIEDSIKQDCQKLNRSAYAAGVIAYLVYHLDLQGMEKVAAFAASMMKENAEPRLQFTHDCGHIFVEGRSA